MSESTPHDDSDTQERGLFKRYPKLGVLIVAAVSFGLLFAMCAIVAILIVRG